MDSRATAREDRPKKKVLSFPLSLWQLLQRRPWLILVCSPGGGPCCRCGKEQMAPGWLRGRFWGKTRWNCSGKISARGWSPESFLGAGGGQLGYRKGFGFPKNRRDHSCLESGLVSAEIRPMIPLGSERQNQPSALGVLPFDATGERPRCPVARGWSIPRSQDWPSPHAGEDQTSLRFVSKRPIEGRRELRAGSPAVLGTGGLSAPQLVARRIRSCRLALACRAFFTGVPWLGLRWAKTGPQWPGCRSSLGFGRQYERIY